LQNLTLINEQLFKHISRKSRFVLQYVIPVLLMSYFYSRIIYHLFRKRNSDIRISNIRFEKKVWKTTKMLIACVIVFTVCYFAFYFSIMKNLLNLESKNHNLCEHIGTTLFYIFYIIFLTSCLLNPIIYWWMSSNFRKDFKRILCIRN
jgi:amino acid transporter